MAKYKPDPFVILDIFGPTQKGKMQKNDRIEIDRDYDQVSWSLPFRDLKEFTQYGWFVLAFGVIAVLFMTAWVAAPLYFGVTLVAQGQWFGTLMIGFSMLGIGMLIFGARILVLGRLILKNQTRSVVQIYKGKLISIEKLGWFDWRRKVKLKDIHEFQIKDSSRMAKAKGGSFADAGKVLLAKTDKKEFMVVMGYADELINELANSLSAEIGKEIGVRQIVADRAKAGMEASTKGIPIRNETDEETIPEKPSDSRIVVHEKGEQIAYEIPPAGYKGPAGFVFAFSCIWNLFCIFFIVQLLIEGAGELAEGIVVVVFSILGILMLVFSIYLARYRVMIGLVGDQLFIEKKSILGTKWIEYAISDIRRIFVGESRFENDDEPTAELKIQTVDGKEQGLLHQLSEPELKWLAYHLMQSTGVARLPKEEVTWQSEVAKLGGLQLPESSSIRVDERVDGVRIRVPMKLSSLFPPILVGVFSIGVAWVMGIPIKNTDVIGIAFAVVFGAVGILVTLISLEFCTRRFVFEVEGKILTARRISVLSKTVVQLHRDDVQSIDIGASNMRINGNECYQIQIRADGKSFNGMTNWSIPELAVVAGLLNQSLESR